MGMLLREGYFSSVCQPVCIFTPYSKGPLKILISIVNGDGDTVFKIHMALEGKETRYLTKEWRNAMTSLE